MDVCLGWQIPRCGDEKVGQMPRPASTLQIFSLIAQSNSASLSILMSDFFFQLQSNQVKRSPQDSINELII